MKRSLLLMITMLLFIGAQGSGVFGQAEDLALLRYEEGKKAFQEERWLEASEKFSIALKLSNDKGILLNSRYFRGYCNFKLNRCTEAIEDMTSMVSDNPSGENAKQVTVASEVISSCRAVSAEQASEASEASKIEKYLKDHNLSRNLSTSERQKGVLWAKTSDLSLITDVKCFANGCIAVSAVSIQTISYTGEVASIHIVGNVNEGSSFASIANGGIVLGGFIDGKRNKTLDRIRLRFLLQDGTLLSEYISNKDDDYFWDKRPFDIGGGLTGAVVRTVKSDDLGEVKVQKSHVLLFDNKGSFVRERELAGGTSSAIAIRSRPGILLLLEAEKPSLSDSVALQRLGSDGKTEASVVLDECDQFATLCESAAGHFEVVCSERGEKNRYREVTLDDKLKVLARRAWPAGLSGLCARDGWFVDTPERFEVISGRSFRKLCLRRTHLETMDQSEVCLGSVASEAITVHRVSQTYDGGFLLLLTADRKDWMLMTAQNVFETSVADQQD